MPSGADRPIRVVQGPRAATSARKAHRIWSQWTQTRTRGGTAGHRLQTQAPGEATCAG